jgi:type IV pilus assembly protein PilE
MQAPSPRKTGAGFSLIELMIVVAIIAILAAIAVPSYVKYMQQGRRSDALAGIALDQGILERCYATTFDYKQDQGATPPAGCSTFQTVSPSKYYNIVLVINGASPASSYTVTATPVAGGAQASDTACATMSVTSANVQTPTPAGGITNCWAQ